MSNLEKSTVHGRIHVNQYVYDDCKDTTYINATIKTQWNCPPFFHFTDYLVVQVKGSRAFYSRWNSSSSACYINAATGQRHYVHDVFVEMYESFDTITYKIPVQLDCGEMATPHILEWICVTYHVIASGKVDLSEIKAWYRHEILKPNHQFSIIVALASLTPPITLANFQFVPTYILTSVKELITIWSVVERLQLKKIDVCK